MIRNRSAQAAMEFILTYGWAIVVVTASISALAYFGVLDMDSWFPNQCTIDVGISCLDHKMSFVPGAMGGPDTNNLELIIKNNAGWKIENIKVKFPKWSREQQFNAWSLENNQKNNKGDLLIDDITNSNPAYNIGDKYEIDFIISVENSQSGLTHQYKGTVKGKLK